MDIMQAGIAGIVAGGIIASIGMLAVSLPYDSERNRELKNLKKELVAMQELQNSVTCSQHDLLSDVLDRCEPKGTAEELWRTCTKLRWMLGNDRCLRCDEACTMEESGLCPLDERLAELGVTVPDANEVGHVSQCQEEDR